MGVTLSRAAERKARPMAVPGAALPVHRRSREALLLGAGALVFLLGLVLLDLAVTRPFAAVRRQLAKGEVVDLNQVRQAEELLPALSPLGSPAERAFAARRIVARLEEGPVPNVGALGRLRVEAAEVDADRLPGLGERLRRADGGSVSLLTQAEVRAIKPRLIVRTPGRFRVRLWLWAALVLAAFGAVHLFFRLRRFAGDELVLPALLALSGLGFLFMTSVRDPLRDLALSGTFAQGVVAGCALLALASQVEVERSPLRRLAWPALGAAFLLSIVLIAFGSGPGTSDAKVNLLGFQPVEAIKLLVALFLAAYFADRWELLRELPERRERLAPVLRWVRLPKLEYALPPLLAMAVVLVFFFLQRDLGPALVLSFLFLLLYAVARGRSAMVWVGTALLVAAFGAAALLGYPRTVAARLAMWLSPWDNAVRGGDHLAQALWALAGGALTGTGLGLGQPARVPEAHTDMVLAAVGEELGFLGLLAVFALYAVLVQRGLRAARRAGGTFGFFLALGLALLAALHVLLIGGGVVGLLPLSGVASPFLSFGRSALLANFLLFGAVLAVSARPGKAEGTRRFHGPVRWVAIGLAALLAGILGRAAWVQAVRPNATLTRGALTLQGDGVRRFSYDPRLTELAGSIPRGAIVDRNGIPLATSDPKDLAGHRAVYERLGVAVERLGAEPGERVYPFGGRTFHLLGDLRNRVNWAASNTSYAERDERVHLQGWDDYAAVVPVEQADGRTTREVRYDYRELVPLLRHRHQPGSRQVESVLKRDRTLRLSIDVRLQAAAARILEKWVRQAGRNGGAAVVLDAGTGELLASVSYPWPERLPVQASADPSAGVIDRARYGIYPPGSTFKIVTAMAALRQDPAAEDLTYECQELSGGRVGNRVRGWGRPIRDDPTVKAPHGTVNLEKGIRVSCNAYFAQLAVGAVRPEPLFETARLLGIAVARPNTPEDLEDALPQASYGQGEVVATPLQMARVAAAIAAGGLAPEGRWVLEEGSRRVEPARIVPAPQADLIARAMRQVVTVGTAAPYVGGVTPPMAGKTGTAEVQGKRSHSWFIGFAPYGAAEGRKIAVAVVVEHGGYGGRLAAPAAGEIVRAAAGLGLIR